jgi:phytoene dehydrogenase-like protein
LRISDCDDRAFNDDDGLAAPCWKGLSLTYDFIIIGAGHNGLAAGVILARAGRKVLILEKQATPGGCVQTAEVTLPGFRHDLYATNLSAFAGSAFAQEFAADLARHGLEFVRAPNAYCSVFPDGDCVGVTTSLEQTVSEMARVCPADAARWRALFQRYLSVGPQIGNILREPMPSWKSLRLALGLPLSVLPIVFGSTSAFTRRNFESEKTRALVAAWGMHLDFAPEISGGALYPFLQCMSAQEKGLPIAKGGAQSLIAALVGLCAQYGGELRCGCRADSVVIENGNATGVIAGGERIAAREGVIATITPPALSKGLAPGAPEAMRRKAGRYRFGPGTMMIHLALSDLPDWKCERAREFFYIHLAPSLAAMSKAYRQAQQGALPDEPLLIVAQPTIADPSRAPSGRHVLSIQVRVLPPRADWDAIKESYADRMLDFLERYAPGLRNSVLGRHVMSPTDLHRANPNLVGGDSLAGSHHLSQQFIFRPFLGWSRYETPVSRLYLCGAATWPGAGTGAGSGWILGQRLAGDR